MNCLKNFRPQMRYHKRSKASFSFLRVRILICLCLLLSVLLSASSCVLPWNYMGAAGTDASVIAERDSNLDRQSLVQELATCISDVTQIDYVYHSIPAAQLDGISYADFYAYILALTRLNIGTGPITSFRFVPQKESQSITDSIAANAADYKSLLQATIPVEIFYGNEQTGGSPVYIYIQEDVNGTAYLSNIWVKECLNIFDFAGLYFGALEKENSEAVASLIKGSHVPKDGEFSPAVINYMAGELTSYYRVRVKSTFTEYRLESLDISQLTYLQPEVLDDISVNYQTRTVRFVRNSQNHVSIKDSVNKSLASKELFLYMNGEKTIRIGYPADSKTFKDLLGEPVGATYGMQFSPNASQGINQQIIDLTYASVSVTIQGSFYDDGSWDGQITRIRLLTPDQGAFMGTTIFVGMTRDALLMLYPFADQTDYTLTVTQDDQDFKMAFTFADDQNRTVTGVQLDLAG